MANRESRTVSFTPEHDDYVSRCVESGRYQSASEVVRAGLRLLQDEDERRRAELERVRGEIRVGAEQLERGETVEGEEVFQRWSAKHRDLKAAEGEIRVARVIHGVQDLPSELRQTPGFD